MITATGVAQTASEHPGRPDSGRTSRVTRPYSAPEKRHWSYLTVWQVRSPVAIPSPCVVFSRCRLAATRCSTSIATRQPANACDASEQRRNVTPANACDTLTRKYFCYLSSLGCAQLHPTPAASAHTRRRDELHKLTLRSCITNGGGRRRVAVISAAAVPCTAPGASSASRQVSRAPWREAVAYMWPTRVWRGPSCAAGPRCYVPLPHPL